MKKLPLIVPLFVVVTACVRKKFGGDEVQQDAAAKPGSFGFDLTFLKNDKEVIVVGDSGGLARIAIVKDYQGRVMTSTASGDEGNSYGWINYKLISDGKTLPHFNPVGGEDRFWIGPEGGQYAIYFKKGVPFDFQNWQTPSLIDSEPFELVSQSSSQATFEKSASITNYQGYVFSFSIQRQIKLLSREEA